MFFSAKKSLCFSYHSLDFLKGKKDIIKKVISLPKDDLYIRAIANLATNTKVSF